MRQEQLFPRYNLAEMMAINRDEEYYRDEEKKAGIYTSS